MDPNTLPDFVFAGPSKSASSWIHEALDEHPEILMPDIKPVSYFNLKYHQGEDWYRSVFDERGGEHVVGDSSPGYLKNRHAPRRISEQLADTTMFYCLRNPIDRAWSQWWMEYSNGWVTHDFDNVLFHHPDYTRLVEPGFYAAHLHRWDRHFEEDQLKVFLFDDFKQDNESFIQEMYSILSVDDTYKPSILGERVNKNTIDRFGLVTLLKQQAPQSLKNALSPVYDEYSHLFESRADYEQGMDENVRKALEVHYHDDIRRLSERLERDLDHWVDHVDLNEDRPVEQVSFDDAFKLAHRSWSVA